LTGGIATGKSTVSRLLQTEHHIPVIDADVLARQVVEPGKCAYRKIVREFGTSILLPNGQIDRKKLGEIVFSDESKRKRLNGIVHPAVKWAMIVAVIKHWWKGSRWVVLDVPLLIEGGIYKWVGEVVVVYCPAEVQRERLMGRDGLSAADAERRMSAQMSIEAKVGYAQVVLDNRGDVAGLEEQVTSYVMRRNSR
jgi:dephospho-CoA kinase